MQLRLQVLALRHDTLALVSPYPCLRGYAYARNNIRNAEGW
jgi:hypothetical protein